jgi:hypothetical protein
MNILEKLNDARIFSVELDKHKSTLIFTESCDAWFDSHLNKEEVLQLIKELTDLVNEME